MDERDEGLTLEGLARRLQTLEHENTELRNEVAALRGSGTRRNGPAATRSLVPRRNGERASGYEGVVSRRSLLSKAGAAAVVAVAAGALLPREANAHTDGLENVDAHNVWAHYVEVHRHDDVDVSGVLGLTNSSSAASVYGKNDGTGPGVEGISNGSSGKGVEGTGRYGVWGESNQAGFYGVTGRNSNTDGTGVRGVTNNTDGRTGVRGEGATGVWGSSPKTGYSGVYGQHTGSSGFGVVGDGKGGSAGVLGRNPGGAGVRGEGVIGVRGLSSTTGQAGLYGEHSGQGPGIVGDGRGPDYAGVRGRNSDGTGVWGSSSKTGYGAVYGQHTGSSGYGIVGDGKGGSAGVLGRNTGGRGGQGRGFHHSGSGWGAGSWHDGGVGQFLQDRVLGSLRPAHRLGGLRRGGGRDGCYGRRHPRAQPRRPRYRGKRQRIRREVRGKPGAVDAQRPRVERQASRPQALTSRARSRWTLRRRCGCARCRARQAHGGRSQRPPTEDRNIAFEGPGRSSSGPSCPIHPSV